MCKIVLLFAAVVGFSSATKADDLEYRMEVGGMLGVSSYYGDAKIGRAHV